MADTDQRIQTRLEDGSGNFSIFRSFVAMPAMVVRDTGIGLISLTGQALDIADWGAEKITGGDGFYKGDASQAITRDLEDAAKAIGFHAEAQNRTDKVVYGLATAATLLIPVGGAAGAIAKGARAANAAEKTGFIASRWGRLTSMFGRSATATTEASEIAQLTSKARLATADLNATARLEAIVAARTKSGAAAVDEIAGAVTRSADDAAQAATGLADEAAEAATQAPGLWGQASRRIRSYFTYRGGKPLTKKIDLLVKEGDAQSLNYARRLLEKAGYQGGISTDQMTTLKRIFGESSAVTDDLLAIAERASKVQDGFIAGRSAQVSNFLHYARHYKVETVINAAKGVAFAPWRAMKWVFSGNSWVRIPTALGAGYADQKLLDGAAAKTMTKIALTEFGAAAAVAETVAPGVTQKFIENAPDAIAGMAPVAAEVASGAAADMAHVGGMVADELGISEETRAELVSSFDTARGTFGLFLPGGVRRALNTVGAVERLSGDGSQTEQQNEKSRLVTEFASAAATGDYKTAFKSGQTLIDKGWTQMNWFEKMIFRFTGDLTEKFNENKWYSSLLKPLLEGFQKILLAMTAKDIVITSQFDDRRFNLRDHIPALQTRPDPRPETQ